MIMWVGNSRAGITNVACLDLAQIEEFAGDTLDGSRRRLLEAHLGACGECRQRLEDARANLSLARLLARMPLETRASPGNGGLDSAGPERDATQRSPARDTGDSAGPPTAQFPGYAILREISRGGQGIVYE